MIPTMRDEPATTREGENHLGNHRLMRRKENSKKTCLEVSSAGTGPSLSLFVVYLTQADLIVEADPVQSRGLGAHSMFLMKVASEPATNYRGHLLLPPTLHIGGQLNSRTGDWK